MAKDPSIRAFRCPSCGAPQEPESGTLTMKCGHCSGTSIIPESLRTLPRGSGASTGDVFSFGLKGVDLNKVVGNAMQLPEAISLAQQGRVDEAAVIYSRITGIKHTDAVKAVESLASGHAVGLSPGRSGATWQQFETSYSTPSTQLSDADWEARDSKRGCGAMLGIAALIGILMLVLGVGAFFLFGGTELLGSVAPAGIATTRLTFGEEGSGQGMFKDPRALGVDQDGNITVVHFDDGRVQTFNEVGEFVAGFPLNPDGKKVYVTSMAVGRDGTVYVVHTGEIFVFDRQGNPLGEISDKTHRYDGVAVGGDGKLYATSDHEDIVRFRDDHTIDLEVPDTFTTVTGDLDTGTSFAADGLGNMYIAGSFHYLILKYSPQGTYVDQFGGQAEAGNGSGTGKFTSPRAIAVDGYGRVVVADFFDIKVFDGSGGYLATIDLHGGVPFGITVDKDNFVYVVTNKSELIKYEVKPPAQE